MLLLRSLPQSSKYFTPSYLVFGLNVQVPGLKLPKWNIFLEFGLNVQVSRVKLPQWNRLFSKSFTQHQKHICYTPRFYPRPPKNFTQIYLLCLWHFATLWPELLYCKSPWFLRCAATTWPCNLCQTRIRRQLALGCVSPGPHLLGRNTCQKPCLQYLRVRGYGKCP